MNWLVIPPYRIGEIVYDFHESNLTKVTGIQFLMDESMRPVWVISVESRFPYRSLEEICKAENDPRIMHLQIPDLNGGWRYNATMLTDGSTSAKCFRQTEGVNDHRS